MRKTITTKVIDDQINSDRQSRSDRENDRRSPFVGLAENTLHRHSVAELLSVGQVGIFDQLMFTLLSLVQQQQQGVSRKLSLFQIFQKYQFMARDPYIHIVPVI